MKLHEITYKFQVYRCWFFPRTLHLRISLFSRPSINLTTNAMRFVLIIPFENEEACSSMIWNCVGKQCSFVLRLMKWLHLEWFNFRLFLEKRRRRVWRVSVEKLTLFIEWSSLRNRGLFCNEEMQESFDIIMISYLRNQTSRIWRKIAWKYARENLFR